MPMVPQLGHGTRRVGKVKCYDIGELDIPQAGEFDEDK